MLNEEDAIRPAGAARLAGVTEATIRRWVREKRLTKYEDGLGRMYIDRREVQELLAPRPVTEVGA
jgi:excisionase family DNA binding protein